MPEDILPDYYEILQVHPKASPEVIEAAWRRLSSMYHPDRYKEADGEERMKKINNAHDILKNPQERTKYDAARKLQEEMQRQASFSEEEKQRILDEIARKKRESEEYIDKLARQRRRENEEELNRRVEEERKRLKREAEQLAEEVIEKARQSGQTGQGSSSDSFPLPPRPYQETSQRQTGDITWKSPPESTPKPATIRNGLIIAVVIFVIAGLFTVIGTAGNSRNNSASQNNQSTPTVTPPLPLAQAEQMVIDFYNTKGDYAGEYVIGKINSIAFYSENGDQWPACVSYEYAEPYNPSLFLDSDTRIFNFQENDTGWQVVNMEGSQSCSNS